MSSNESPPETDATIYIAEDGRALLPLVLSREAWDALERLEPERVEDLHRVNLIAICVAGLGRVTEVERGRLCGG